jgi:O-antigen/teichoic acid export membrane protein
MESELLSSLQISLAARVFVVCKEAAHPMAMIAVEKQTERQARIATLPAASAPSIPRWRLWGTRLSFSLVDPATTISAGLLVSLLMARWLPAQQYGAFALASGVSVFLAGAYNALVLEPMSIQGPANYPGSLADYFEAQIWAHLAFSGALAAPLLLAAAFLALFGLSGPLPGAFLGAGLALPFMLLLWLASRMCRILERPVSAMYASACSLALLLGGLLALQTTHKITPFRGFLFLGFGSLCGALLIFRKLRIGQDETRPCSVPWLCAAAENWRHGRSLLGGAICFASLGQTAILLAPIFLGLAAVGKLLAMQLPALLMLQCSAAASVLFLPGAARHYADGDSKSLRRLAHRVSLSLAGASLLIGVLLYFTAAAIERLLFGGRFAGDAWLMPLFMLIPLFAALASGYSLALRMHRPHFELLASGIAAAVSVQTAFLFIPLWGLAGAVISMASGFAVQAALVCLCFRQATASDGRILRSEQRQEVASFDQVHA